jgi:hypothetical protein
MADSTQRVSVPKTDWNGRAADMRSRLLTWRWHWQLAAGKTEVELDFSRVSFMEPWALAMFAAYGLGLRRAGVRVRGVFLDENPANAYARAMGLDEILTTGESTAATRQWSESHRNTGLHVIRNYDDLDAFRRSTQRLYLQHCEDAADALRYALTEFGRNVLQHSGSPIGGVAIAQHFPDDGRLQVAMCDLGCGVRASLVPRYPELRTDMESLRLAVLPHVSGAQAAGPYGGSENAGLGLFFSREIAWRAGGSLWLASQTALLGIRGDREAIWEQPHPQPDRVYRRIEPWPGTIVVSDFPVKGIADFAAILAVCRDLAAEARRMSGPAGLDFLSSTHEIEAAFTVRVHDFEENNATAVAIRDQEIRPRVERGEAVILDFSGVRSPTQSFVHALLAEVFQIPGSLLRLSFLNCTRSAQEILKAVAAYASYRQIL